MSYRPQKPKTQAVHDALVMTLRQLEAPVTLTELARLAIGNIHFPHPSRETYTREADGQFIQGVAGAMERAGEIRYVGPSPISGTSLYEAGPNLPEVVDVSALEDLVSTPVDPPTQGDPQ